MVLNLPREPRSSVLLPITTEQSCAAAWEAGAATGSKRGAHDTALHGTVTVQNPKSLLGWEGWWGHWGGGETPPSVCLPPPSDSSWSDLAEAEGFVLQRYCPVVKADKQDGLGIPCSAPTAQHFTFPSKRPVPPLYLVPPSAQSHAQPIPCSSSPLCWHLAPKQEVLSPKARKRGEPRLLPAAPG